jgi:hypothetical protein
MLRAAVVVCGLVLALATGTQGATLDFGACEWAYASSKRECDRSTNNFVVRSFVGGPNAEDVARHCQQVRARLQKEVFAVESPAGWQPKCTVVLHASRSAYMAAVGGNGSQTIGSSTISIGAGRVTKRRIDLLAVDVEKGLAALPHELVHVLFVDAFPTVAPPKWAEEGLALVMDSRDKRVRHLRDLDAALQSHSTLPLRRLLADDNYPSASHRAAFYGQSLSLVEYLMQTAPPQDFIRFVKLSTTHGADRALTDVYRLSATELERDWRNSLTSTALASAD